MICEQVLSLKVYYYWIYQRAHIIFVTAYYFESTCIWECPRFTARPRPIYSSIFNSLYFTRVLDYQSFRIAYFWASYHWGRHSASGTWNYSRLWRSGWRADCRRATCWRLRSGTRVPPAIALQYCCMSKLQSPSSTSRLNLTRHAVSTWRSFWTSMNLNVIKCVILFSVQYCTEHILLEQYQWVLRILRNSHCPNSVSLK